jgi:ADP-ribose pyrophosphatase YjhB (NUDIX family)
MQEERFKVYSAVYLIPIKGSKVLLSRRYNTGWMDGKYSLISGHLDGGEPASKAMIREAYEEAKIKVKTKDLIPLTVLHRNSNSGREYIDFFFAVKKWQGEPEIGELDKYDDLSWFDTKKLPKNTLPYIKDIIKNIKKLPAFSEIGW